MEDDDDEALYRGGDTQRSELVQGMDGSLNDEFNLSPQDSPVEKKPNVGVIAEIPSFRGNNNASDSAEQPQQQSTHDALPPPDTKKVLSLVEGFLLPRSDQTCPWRKGPIHNSVERANLRPEARLLDVLYQVALADHIRTFQTMYRDSHDEQRLFAELRGDDASKEKEGSNGTAASRDKESTFGKKETTHLPTHTLTTKIVEGRIRAGALCRLCYGENSIELLKATTDLAASYAMQGMWDQVSERLAAASGKLITIVSKNNREKSMVELAMARSAAAKVACTYGTLRSHAMAHRGQVTRDVLEELAVALGQLANTTEEEFLLTANNRGGDPDQALTHPTQLVALLHGFFSRFALPKQSQEENEPKADTTIPSWGQVVDYLRYDCVLMKTWVEQMEAGILPQNRMTLHVPFTQGDGAKRGICHPMQASYQLSRSPAAIKVLSGTSLIKKLQSLKVEMPLWINPVTGHVKKLNVEQSYPVNALEGNTADQFELKMSTPGGRSDSNKPRIVTNDETSTPTQTVLYELPVLWEEIEAMHVSEMETDGADLLRAQVLTLLGVCHIFSNKLDSAEQTLREALRLIEALGLEQEPVACELYNSIAQLMIVKHRAWQSSKSVRAEKEATKYLASETGKADLKALYTTMKDALLEEEKKQDFITMLETGVQHTPTLSKEKREELQARAQASLLRSKIKEYMSSETDPTARVVEAAFRYLVRAYEIISEAHGVYHPGSGTASLAVASVQSSAGNYEDAREWLARALRSFEKLNPLPRKAIAFTQVQLSQLLTKQGHTDEALSSLDKAAQYHIACAREGIATHAREQQGSFGVFVPILKGTPVYDSVSAALTMTGKLCRMLVRRGGKWQATEQADIAAQLAEGAFGWDSLITGEALRELALRCVAITDWARAAAAYKRARDAFEAVNGKKCKKALLCGKGYSKALEKQHQENEQLNEKFSDGNYAGPQGEAEGPQTNTPSANAGESIKGALIDDTGDINAGLDGGLSAEAGMVGDWNDTEGIDDMRSVASALTASPNNSPPGTPPLAERKGVNSSLPGMLTP